VVQSHVGADPGSEQVLVVLAGSASTFPV